MTILEIVLTGYFVISQLTIILFVLIKRSVRNTVWFMTLMFLSNPIVFIVLLTQYFIEDYKKNKRRHKMKKEKETVKIEEESKMYRLYEIRDEIQAAIENIDKVSEQQKKLISIVNDKEENKTEFADFTKSLNESIDEILKQKTKLIERLSYLNAVIEVYEDRSTDEKLAIANTVDMMVTYAMKALGM